MGEQIRGGQTTLDRPRRSRRLDNAITIAASELGADVAYHLIRCRDALQLFGDIFAELPQLAAAIGTALVLGHVRDDLARQVFGKRLTPWSRWTAPGLRI